MFNNFDFNLVVNLTVSITLSLFIFHTIGQSLSDILSDFFKLLLRSFLSWLEIKYRNRFSPINLFLSYIDVKSEAYSPNPIHKINLTLQKDIGIGIDLLIILQGSKYWNKRYKKIQIQLLDSRDVLGLYSVRKQSGLPPRYIIAEFNFKMNERKNVHIDFKPQIRIINYRVPLYIILIGDNDDRILETTLIFGKK